METTTDPRGLGPQERQAGLIGRVRYLIEMSRMSQAAFARRIGIDPSNLSKHLSGKLAINDSLINRIVVETGVSKGWLRTGADVPFAAGAEPGTVGADEWQLMPVEECRATQRGDAGTPVYDIDVTAGCEELSRMFTADRVIGMVNLPRLNRDCAIVHVSGDSMSPVIQNGGYVAIRPVRDLRNIFWGQIYVVVLDDYRMIKFVKRHHDRDMVILHSANPAYEDMEVDRADIRSLFMVEMVLNCEMRG